LPTTLNHHKSLSSTGKVNLFVRLSVACLSIRLSAYISATFTGRIYVKILHQEFLWKSVEKI